MSQTHHVLQLLVVQLLLAYTFAGLPRSAFPRAPSYIGASGLASSWPGSYNAGPEATIWRRPVVLCFGDSITQMGSSEWDGYPGWVSKLQTHFNRKADVLNRGFSGFNTKTAALALPEIMDMLSKQQVALAIVWLGANDAAVPEGIDGRAHIPVAAYQSNLQALVQQLLASGVQRVLLLTPPPIFDAAPNAIPAGEKILPRNFKTTSQYAEAARKVAEGFQSQGKVVLLDMWQAFVNSGSDWGNRLLGPDGLHLSRQGNDFVYSQLYDAINNKLPQLTPSNLPWHHPDWWFIDYKEPAQQFGGEQAAYRAVYKA